jgi:hypothetical protein
LLVGSRQQQCAIISHCIAAGDSHAQKCRISMFLSNGTTKRMPVIDPSSDHMQSRQGMIVPVSHWLIQLAISSLMSYLIGYRY